MKLVLSRGSPSSSFYSSDTESLDHYFRVSNLPALRQMFDANPEKVNFKEPKVSSKQLGWTPLFRAVMYGSLEIARYLLEKGAQINEPNNLGESPLHQACENNLYEIAELLLKFGANPNLQQVDGNTALHNAVKRNNIDLVNLLIGHGADVNVQDYLVSAKQFGKTVLHLAAENENQEIINLLLSADADSNLLDYSGRQAEMKINSCLNDESSEELPAKAQMVYTLASYQDNDSLYLWLKKFKLDEIFSALSKHGITEIDKMMKQNLTEKDLIEMRIKKMGVRLRLLYKINDEFRCRSDLLAKNKVKVFPELKSWLEEGELSEVYERLIQNGFYMVEDLYRLEQSKRLTEVLRAIGIKDHELFKLGVLLYRFDTEPLERGSDNINRISERNRAGDCGICCAFTNIFN